MTHELAVCISLLEHLDINYSSSEELHTILKKEFPKLDVNIDNINHYFANLEMDTNELERTNAYEYYYRH